MAWQVRERVPRELLNSLLENARKGRPWNEHLYQVQADRIDESNERLTLLFQRLEYAEKMEQLSTQIHCLNLDVCVSVVQEAGKYVSVSMLLEGRPSSLNLLYTYLDNYFAGMWLREGVV